MMSRVTPTTANQRLELLVASLTLSLLSMAYGFYCYIADNNKDVLPRRRRPQLFLCVLLHNTWFLAAAGSFLAAAAAAALPAWLPSLGFVLLEAHGLAAGAMLAWAGARQTSDNWCTAAFFAVVLCPISVVLSAIDMAPLNLVVNDDKGFGRIEFQPIQRRFV